VCDVFASPIKETVGFQCLQKCGRSVAREVQPAKETYLDPFPGIAPGLPDFDLQVVMNIF
jgi:hypothetical protein